jgi:hypothetical protein
LLRERLSAALTVLARTRMSTSVGPGTGTGTSSMRTTDGPPKRL